MNDVVLDASAGVEMLLRTPADVRTWVPEIYLTEVAGVLRRDELHGRHDAARVRVAFDPSCRPP